MNNINRDFLIKLSLLQQDFNYKIEELKKEYQDDITKYIEKQNFNYTIVNKEKIDTILNKYKKSKKHYFYSYNTLVSNYIDAYNRKAQKSQTRWFIEIAVNHPDKINNFLALHKDILFNTYEKILLKIGYHI